MADSKDDAAAAAAKAKVKKQMGLVKIHCTINMCVHLLGLVCISREKGDGSTHQSLFLPSTAHRFFG